MGGDSLDFSISFGDTINSIRNTILIKLEFFYILFQSLLTHMVINEDSYLLIIVLKLTYFDLGCG